MRAPPPPPSRSPRASEPRARVRRTPRDRNGRPSARTGQHTRASRACLNIRKAWEPSCRTPCRAASTPSLCILLRPLPPILHMHVPYAPPPALCPTHRSTPGTRALATPPPCRAAELWRAGTCPCNGSRANDGSPSRPWLRPRPRDPKFPLAPRLEWRFAPES